MATLNVKTVAGKAAGKVELDDEIFAVKPNVPVMHQVVTAQLAARRSGTQSTKTRSDVSGGGAKPFRQKGTGNARQGSTRAPHFTGGGVALGPKPRSYDQKTPKKMVKLALKSALSDRAAEGKVVVVDSWGFETPKTKDAKQALAALGIDGTALVVVGRDDTAAALSFRNLPTVQLVAPGELNAYDVLCNDWIVFTKNVLPATEPASAGSGSARDEPEAPRGESEADALDTDSAQAGEGSASDEPEAPRGESEADALDTDSAQAGEGSASDEPEAPRGESEADAEQAIKKGSASDEPEAPRGESEADALDTDSAQAGEGSASDEPEAPRGESEADAEQATEKGKS